MSEYILSFQTIAKSGEETPALVPTNWFSWDFRVLQNGSLLAEIDISSWREKGVLTVGVIVSEFNESNRQIRVSRNLPEYWPQIRTVREPAFGRRAIDTIKESISRGSDVSRYIIAVGALMLCFASGLRAQTADSAEEARRKFLSYVANGTPSSLADFRKSCADGKEVGKVREDMWQLITTTSRSALKRVIIIRASGTVPAAKGEMWRLLNS